MESIPLLDRAGRRRSPATTATFHQGASPGNKGLRYPPDPPTVEEIIAVMRTAAEGMSLIVIHRQLGHADLAITPEIPAGHRQYRDHPSRPSAARTDDPRQSTTPARALIADCLLRQRGRAVTPRGPTNVQEQ
jgi:hypothetical protein